MKVLLVGNYSPDAQESMRRYAELMRSALSEAGHDVSLVEPRKMLNAAGRPPEGVWKWIGYLDKYLLNLPALSRAAKLADVVHVCDHSNSLYVPSRSKTPYVVTCHDMLAIRGALGEETDCPATFAGRQLQLGILGGLRRSQGIACVSSATLRDAQRLMRGYPGEMILAPNALNYSYTVIEPTIARARISAVSGLGDVAEYVLNVGSNLRRKNREGALRAVAAVASSWSGHLVFAGQPLTAELWSLAGELGIANRIVEVHKPSNELLEALYNGALALLFPSRFEGFGWPIIEAQACGCPVICSDREPLPEVAGDAAITCNPDDHVGFGMAVAWLANHKESRQDLRHRGLENAQRYGKAQMADRFVSLYEQLAAAA
jgi:glycosyltransferase involved in cell wall biosynthesis